MTVADVMNMSGRDALVTVPIDSSTVGDVVDAMVKQQLHRLCVTSRGGQVEWLLSQLDVVTFFSSRLSPALANTRLSELGRKSELGFLSQHTISIDENDSVLHAFQLMDRHAITALPVVAEQRGNVLRGTISLKDVPRALDHLFERCSAVLLPVHDAACVELDSTFQSLLTAFQITKFHRFWIVGDGNRLTGVISLTDVIRTLKTHMQ
jgi:CBS-domain-containing membrane protein